MTQLYSSWSKACVGWGVNNLLGVIISIIKLAQFESILDAIDINKKHAYLIAKDKCPHLCNNESKLIFLRCEVFNVKNAVDRFVKYWNMRLEVFDEELAFLPMTLEGAMKHDIEAIQLKYLQLAKDNTTDGYT